MKLFHQKKNKESARGFTLVETLVAVTILVIASLGPIVIAAQGIISAGYAKDQITAYYLAQEGIEYVRNIRDANALQGRTSSDPTSGNYWLTDLSYCVPQNNYQSNNTSPGCYGSVAGVFDTQSSNATLSPCPNPSQGGCSSLKINIDPTSKYYVYTPGTATSFGRTIQILDASSGNQDEKIVKVTIDWVSRTASRTFTVQETIYNSY